MLDLLSVFSAVTEWLVLIGLPLLIFARRPRTGERRIPARFFVSVLLVWLGLVAHRLLIGLPVAMRRAEANGNPGYDGIGVNLGYLFGGWILGLIGSTVGLVIFLIVEWFLRRRTARLLAADDSVRPRNLMPGGVNPYAPDRGDEDNDSPAT
jgi:hypothetical protein